MQTEKVRCTECDHLVEKIAHAQDDKPVVGNPDGTIYAEYKHRPPHRGCPCSRFNMTAQDVR